MPDLKLDEVPDLALGAGVLGGGGGGDPYLAQLLAQALIRETGPVQLWDVDEVSADALVVASAYMGAPMVMAERLPQGDKAAHAVRSMERHLGRPIAALISAEIGGINGLTPVITASHLGLPLVDADYMGRAFPDINMTLADVYGVAATPMVMVDDRGNQVILETVDNVWTETLSRGHGRGCYDSPLSDDRRATAPDGCTRQYQPGDTDRPCVATGAS